MKVTGGFRAVLAVVGFILGWMMLLVSPAAANPDEDSSGGSSGSSDGCPPGGCVNVYGPEETGGSKQKQSSPHDDSSGSSSSGSSGHSSSSGSSGDHSGSAHKPEKQRPQKPEVIVVPGNRTPPPARVQPRQTRPQPQADPGGPFVVQAPPPAPAGVLDVTAVSIVPQSDPSAGTGPSGPGSDDGSTPWELIPALMTAVAGAALALAPGRRPDSGGYAGPTGRFAQAALGGALSAGPPAAKPPVDVKQLAWDWGGHVFGGAAVLVGLLSTPVSGPIIGAGIGIAALSELKRRYWPSKPMTVNDMVGGNPYQAMQQAGNAGIGQTVRDAHGNAGVAQETGDNSTSTWAESQRQVHQETGGETQSFGEARRDATK